VGCVTGNIVCICMFLHTQPTGCMYSMFDCTRRLLICHVIAASLSVMHAVYLAVCCVAMSLPVTCRLGLSGVLLSCCRLECAAHLQVQSIRGSAGSGLLLAKDRQRISFTTFAIVTTRMIYCAAHHCVPSWDQQCAGMPRTLGSVLPGNVIITS
jgi:hypothetical protein